MVMLEGPASGGGGGGATVEDRVKGPWSPEEDVILSRLVSKFGARNWSLIARGIPGRSGKSCRLRWCNQLDPYVKRRPFTGTSSSCLFFGLCSQTLFATVSIIPSFGSFDDGIGFYFCNIAEHPEILGLHWHPNPSKDLEPLTVNRSLKFTDMRQ